MDLKCKMIMEEYKQQRPVFVELGDVVHNILNNITKDHNNISVLAIEHRVKEEKSLAGKLELKGDKYSSLADITDILGCRIICFFADDVDLYARAIEEKFVVDWDNSIDKREAIGADTFGYLSLHYICSLPSGQGYPENICNKKFEIQIRTSLQHTWAVIDHDLGYKSAFGVPRKVKRGFSQVASMLEVADEKFVDLRNGIYAYIEDAKQKIANDEGDDLHIDIVSLSEYMKHNKTMIAFVQSIADLCENCEVNYISPSIYLEQLRFLNIETIGDLHDMVERNKDLALKYAKYMLESTDLDILSTNVGLRFICRAEVTHDKYSYDDVVKYMNIIYEDDVKSERQAKRLLTLADRFKNEN